jgi:phosphoglycerate dehydrogenase-like enzyme
MKIVLPDPIDIPAIDQDKLKSLAEVTVYDDVVNDEAVIIDRIQGAELITAAWVDISERIIQSSPSLRYIVVPGVGYDNIDTQSATAAGIQVINCPTHNTAAVAEYTIALIFAITRRMFAASQSLRAGAWQTERFKGAELRGKKLGLIGYGGIGRQVEKLAIALDMKVSHATSQTSPEAIDQLIADVDILSLHLPLTPKTQYLIDQRRLNLMQPSAYLINTARGAIVDPQALLTTLKQNRIAGAALDVFENEPVGATPNPTIIELAQLDQVIATPHIAYNTNEAAANLGQELIQNITACIQGHPINVVN